MTNQILLGRHGELMDEIKGSTMSKYYVLKLCLQKLKKINRYYVFCVYSLESNSNIESCQRHNRLTPVYSKYSTSHLLLFLRKNEHRTKRDLQ